MCTRKRASVSSHALEQQRDPLLSDHAGSPSAAPSIRSASSLEVCAAVLLGLLAASARADRLAELEHLAAGVVDVVLALYAIAGPLEYSRQRVPVGRVAGGCHRDRTGRVGRHELDLHALVRVAGAEALARLAHGGDRLEVPGVGHEQVQKARAGDLDLLHRRSEPLPQGLAEALRDRPWRLTQRRREQHRGVGGVVAEVGPRRAIELGLGHPAAARERGGGLGNGGVEVGDGIGHAR